MPLDMLITGRIATLAGDEGFGWVEAIGIRDGRIAFAGSEVYLETRADPFTERISLEPDQVAIPGLTDAHLHLDAGGDGRRGTSTSRTRPTLADGLARLRVAHERLPDGAWLEGHGWDSDRWGRLADGRCTSRRSAPGRRAAIWAHDHHALWASHAALREASLPAGDPSGGVIRRAADGSAEGVLLRVRDPACHDPRPGTRRRRARPGAHRASAQDLAAARRRRLPRPGRRRSRPRPPVLVPGLRPPVRRGSPTAARPCLHARRRGRRSDRRPGIAAARDSASNPDGRATVGWQKCFADGSLGSRTAALLEDIEPEADRPLPPEQRRGVWMTDPDGLRERAERAAAGGIATTIHAIGDAAIRAALTS